MSCVVSARISLKGVVSPLLEEFAELKHERFVPCYAMHNILTENFDEMFILAGKNIMITVGKPIEGVTINGLEWLLTETGEVMRFDSTEEAKRFLKENGFKDFSDKDLEDAFVFEESESE